MQPRCAYRSAQPAFPGLPVRALGFAKAQLRTLRGRRKWYQTRKFAGESNRNVFLKVIPLVP
ncbi:hypothetical protein E2320_003071 [Naja naja]|nr:hypothetical protein E2320_003071 [Naja naja]